MGLEEFDELKKIYTRKKVRLIEGDSRIQIVELDSKYR